MSNKSERYEKEKREAHIWLTKFLTLAIAISAGSTYLIVRFAERLHGIYLR